MTLSRRTTLAATAAALSVPASAAEAELWSGNYWAVKWREDKKIWLAMYRKRLGVPQPGEGARPVLFLVHGSSSGAKSSFDLTVPGHGEYSTMNVFAAPASMSGRWTMRAMASPAAPRATLTLPAASRISRQRSMW